MSFVFHSLLFLMLLIGQNSYRVSNFKTKGTFIEYYVDGNKQVITLSESAKFYIALSKGEGATLSIVSKEYNKASLLIYFHNQKDNITKLNPWFVVYGDNEILKFRTDSYSDLKFTVKRYSQGTMDATFTFENLLEETNLNSKKYHTITGTISMCPVSITK